MIKINLLPVREERRKMGARQEQVMLMGVVVLALLGVFYWHTTMNKKIRSVKTEISQVDAEITRLKAVVAEVEKFKKDKKILEEKIAVIDKLKSSRQAQVHYMDEVNRALQPQIWLEFYQQTGKTINLRGKSLATDDIANFMRKLEASQYFEDVRLIQTSQQSVKLGDRPVKVNDFSLTVTVSAGPKGA